MDVERLVLSKIVETQDFISPTDLGVTEKFFLDPTNRGVYRTIVDYLAKHGSVPTLRRIEKDYPNYRFIEVEEPWTDLAEEMRKNYAMSVFEDALVVAVEALDEADVPGITKALREALAAVDNDVTLTRDTNLKETGDQRLKRYKEIQERDPDQYVGIPMGFKAIDQATQGFQKKQLVTFVGPPKAGKSTVLLLAGKAASDRKFRVLFIGFEMSNEEQEERFDSIAAGVDHSVLRGRRDRQLTERDWANLREAIADTARGPDFILSNDTMATMTLSGIAAKVDKYKPDLLIVDGVYMMLDEHGEAPGSPQALTNITRGFKRLAQNKDIPIIITTQVLEWKMDKKKGVTSSSIGYSSSFIQDSDVVISVEPTARPITQKLKVLLGRNVPTGVEVWVDWDWTIGKFTELPCSPFEGDDEGGDDGHLPNV